MARRARSDEQEEPQSEVAAPVRGKRKGNEKESRTTTDAESSKRRKTTGKEKFRTTALVDESENPENEASDAGDDPFGEILVRWKPVRPDFVKPPHHRVQMRGYEGIVGDIRVVLSTFGPEVLAAVAGSALGAFMRLENENNRSGVAINYMVSHQVSPPPERHDIDHTALWFKVEGKILRFSRVEFALVSGLKFGPSTFDPYKGRLEVPDTSIFVRLFDSNHKLNPAELHTTFLKKKYKASDADDAIKMSKLLLATHYVLDFEQARNQIPLWMWVLVEDTQAWEDFPWGSLSYQALVHQINTVAKEKSTRNSKPGYGFKGNSMAFLAWIFCTVPTIGARVGYKKKKRKIPRFLRFSYVKNWEMPENIHAKDLNATLKPSKSELETDFWKSLEQDPEGMPFAFQYDKNDTKKRKPLEDGAGDAGPSRVEQGILNGEDRETLINEIASRAGEVAVRRAREENERFFSTIKERLAMDIGDYVFAKMIEACGPPPQYTMRMSQQFEHSTPPSGQFNQMEQQGGEQVVQQGSEPDVQAATVSQPAGLVVVQQEVAAELVIDEQACEDKDAAATGSQPENAAATDAQQEIATTTLAGVGQEHAETTDGEVNTAAMGGEVGKEQVKALLP